MRPVGQLRHLLTLENRTQAPDLTTGFNETFAAVGTAWACIEPLRGAMQMDGVQVMDAATHWILIRYVEPGTFTHLSDGARRFRKRETKDPDGRRVWLQVHAEEETTGAA